MTELRRSGKERLLIAEIIFLPTNGKQPCLQTFAFGLNSVPFEPIGNDDRTETFWEGEIVDSRNHLFTDKWKATMLTDIRFWTKFSAFCKLGCSIRAKPILNEFPHIFMRWKDIRHDENKREYLDYSRILLLICANIKL